MRKWTRGGWRLLVLALVVTGFAQMPIFKRYYVADVPGLGWLGSPTLNHTLHLALGAAFLVLVGYWAALGARRLGRLTPAGWSRLAVVAVLAGSGLLRAVGDLEGVVFIQWLIIFLDLVHLGSTLAWGGLELGLWLGRRRKGRSGGLQAG